MLAFSDMFYLLPDEFSGLCGRSFTFPRIFTGSLKRFLFRHKSLPLISEQLRFHNVK
jgi:hypothetical protein